MSADALEVSSAPQVSAARSAEHAVIGPPAAPSPAPSAAGCSSLMWMKPESVFCPGGGAGVSLNAETLQIQVSRFWIKDKVFSCLPMGAMSGQAVYIGRMAGMCMWGRSGWPDVYCKRKAA